MREIVLIRWLYVMASSRSKGTDQGIKAFFTSSTVVAKTTGATCSSTDSVFQKEKGESGKPPRAFRLDWLNKFSWLRKEEEGVYCVKCRARSRAENVSFVFGDRPSTNMRVTSFKDHELSQTHRCSLRWEKENQTKPQTTLEEVARHEESLSKVGIQMKVVYQTLLKERPIGDYIADMYLLEELGLKVGHRRRTQNSAWQICEAIEAVFISKVIADLKNAAFIGIMIDESMFIDLTEYLIVFAMYVKAGELHSRFIKLKCLHDQSSEGVFQGLLSVLGEFGVEISKIVGFASDGASVMTGAYNGAASKLKTKAPFCLDFHCVAHKCALAASAMGNVPIAREVDNVLHELHTYFSKSPKRLHRFKTWLELFDDPDVRILKPTNVRWLSRYGCLENFLRTLDSIVRFFQEEAEFNPGSIAEFLFAKITSPRLLLGAHALYGIIKSLAILSKHYQEEELHYEDVVLHLNQCKATIETDFLDSQASFGHVYEAFVEQKVKLKDDGSVQLELPDMDIVDICDSGAEYEEIKGRICHEIKSAALAIISDLETRFPKLDVVTGFCIMDPKFWRQHGLKDTRSGRKELEILLDHFGVDKTVGCQVHSPIVDSEAARSELAHFGSMMKSYSDCSTWAAQAKVLEDSTARVELPNMMKLLEISLVLPFQSVHTERGFSACNRIKNRLRNRLLEPHLNACVRVGVEKVPLRMVDFEEVKVVWRDMKSRYRLIDDHTSEMAKTIEKEEGRYDCGPDKGHTASTFFRPVHHIPKKRKAHDSDMQGALKKRRKKKFKRRIEN